MTNKPNDRQRTEIVNWLRTLADEMETIEAISLHQLNQVVEGVPDGVMKIFQPTGVKAIVFFYSKDEEYQSVVSSMAQNLCDGIERTVFS